MKHSLALARDALLQSGYGKFDLVCNLIPQELLLNGKPRRVMEWFVKNLELDEPLINANTLPSWLHRYRKTYYKKLQPASEHRWQSFEPTAYKPPESRDTLLIKKIKNP